MAKQKTTPETQKKRELGSRLWLGSIRHTRQLLGSGVGVFKETKADGLDINAVVKQLVDLKNIVLPMDDKVLHDHIEFAGVGEGISRPFAALCLPR